MQTDPVYPLGGTLKDSDTAEKREGGNLFLIFLTFVNLVLRKANGASQRLQGIDATNILQILFHYVSFLV